MGAQASRRRILALGLLVATSIMGAPGTAVATAGPAITRLTGLTNVAQILVDDADGYRFVTGGPGQGLVLVVDRAGHVVKTFDRMPGATGMTIHAGILYVALHDASAIGRIRISTLARLPRLRLTAAGPLHLVVAADRLWFSTCVQMQGGLSSVRFDGRGLRTYADAGDPEGCPALAVHPTKPLLFAGATNGDPTTIWRLRAHPGGRLDVLASVWNPGIDGSGSVEDIAITPSGRRLLLACGSPYFAEAFRTDTLASVMTYPTGPYPQAVDAASSAIAVGLYAPYDPDVYVFPPGSQTPSFTYDFGEGFRVYPAGVRLADGGSTLVVAFTGGPKAKLATFDLGA